MTDYDELRNSALDFSNRWHILIQVLQKVGLSTDDISIVLFAAAGNPEENAKLPDILKKFHLPKVDVEYGKVKLDRYIKYISKAIEQWEKSTVFNAANGQIVRNGVSMVTTPYGLDIATIVYNSVKRQLEQSPEYIISVIAGIYKSLKDILEFLEVDVDKL